MGCPLTGNHFLGAIDENIMLGIFKNKYTVEVYGKLPFYKDYISNVATPETNMWQEWLLKIFGQENTFIPEGIWHFLFSPAKNANLVTGIVMQGSDGLRSFPFSLFVSLGRPSIKKPLKWAELFAVKDSLNQIYETLYPLSDINTFYNTIAGASVETHRNTTRSMYLPKINIPEFKSLTVGNAGEFPKFSILSKDGIICLSRGFLSGRSLTEQWAKHGVNKGIDSGPGIYPKTGTII